MAIPLIHPMSVNVSLKFLAPSVSSTQKFITPNKYLNLTFFSKTLRTSVSSSAAKSSSTITKTNPRKKVPINKKKNNNNNNNKKASSSSSPSPSGVLLGFSEGRDEDMNKPVCPGCGVFLQDTYPESPGYFKRPKINLPIENDIADEEDLEDIDIDEIEEELEEGSNEEDDIDFSKLPDDEAELMGFGPAGPGYGSIPEEDFNKVDDTDEDFRTIGDSSEYLSDDPHENLNEFKEMSSDQQNIFENNDDPQKNFTKDEISNEPQKALDLNSGPSETEGEEKDLIVCARCYSLRHYGKVKDWRAENLIPDFDFENTVGKRLMKFSKLSSKTVLVMVVDAVDFDGSFPRRVIKLIKEAHFRSGHVGYVNERFRVVLVATKVDLLPQQVSPARLERWCKIRARECGSPRLDGVFLVSSHKDLGVRNLVEHIKDLAGPRGNVWVVGAQNAGKSTLINAIGKKERGKVTHLTEAPVPGTTLGILRINGILPSKARLYDTPGMVHPYQIMMRLNREEQKMLEIRKELKPRSYRIKVGQSIHVGAVLRIDLVESSVQTIYVSVFASALIPLHMGKTEKAIEIKEKQFGQQLQPPISQERVSELGEWTQRMINVRGNNWDTNSVDVAVAGLGWLSIGIKGDATLGIWTFDEVDITIREPLVLDRARFLEKPGFSLTKSAIKAKNKETKLKDSRDKKMAKSKEDRLDSYDMSIQQLLEVD